MMPQTPDRYFQERAGVNAIAMAALEKQIIWRETTNGDVGIDGQLEYVTAGRATGQTVAVQIKSGTSYFQHADQAGWKFYPEDKHRAYWERFPLPVILILHDPKLRKSFWTDARQALRSPETSARKYIHVPKNNVFETTDSPHLFHTAGVIDQVFLSEQTDVLSALVNRRSLNRSFPVSHFDLFSQGLTNICRSIYFGMDLALNAAEINLQETDSELGIGVGSPEYEFLFDYIKVLIAQNLAEINFSDCLIDWTDRMMIPHFVAPLTLRGRSLVKLIRDKENDLVARGLLEDGNGLHVAQEGFFKMEKLSYFRRLPRIAKFQQLIQTGK